MVTELWRYPVKSMVGERMDRLDLTPGGVTGDRRYALIDRATGRVGSAKLPRRWGPLLGCVPRLTVDGVAVTLPDGTTVAGPGPRLDAALSALLGVDATLTDRVPEGAAIDRFWPDTEGLALRDTETTGPIAAAAPGTFLDHASAHLLTTASLATMRRERPDHPLDARRFRPNIVIDPLPGSDHPFPENGWVGRELSVGDVRLRVTDPAPRCVVPTLPHGDLPGDPGLLRRVAVRNTVAIPALGGMAVPSLGVYATVVRGGALERGAMVTVGG